jgi:serine/threonine protein kinase
MFGLGTGHGDTGTRTGTDTVGRWVAATEGTASGSGDASGRLVHGRYRLIAELGAGGMGVTYRAWDTQAGIPVVVKMPKREVRHDREVMTRFAREIEAMRAVPHESIVPITDSGDDEGCPFVIMRFLPGGSLADYRRCDEAGKPIRNPPGMLHFWLPGVAAALDHIHAKGMLHRDVKPGNIFLDGFLKPYLGDFGIAKVVDESGGLAKEQTLTATKMAVGTPEYMSPELFKPRSRPDGRLDQYALAVTVYEMLSGEKPFKGDRAHIIVEHSGLPVPPLAAKVPGLSQRLCMAVERGLAKKPEERFATCSDFAAAVLSEVATLPPESDTVRLLCPGCKNILKLPQKAAGQTGRCPRCREAIDVAADLGSLWLESEERGGGPPLVAVSQAQPVVPRKQLSRSGATALSWRLGVKPSRIAVIAACLGLAAGYTACVLRERATLGSAFAFPADENTNALTSLSVDEARRWVQKGRNGLGIRELSFDGLSSISPEVARELAVGMSFWQDVLSLDGLKSITPEVARALSTVPEYKTISLDGLESMTPEIATELGAFRGYLTLNGVKNLPPAYVPLLCAKKEDGSSHGLELDGLETLSPALATALATVKGNLSLDGLTTIDPTTAELLSKEGRGDLSLGGLTDLSADSARQLARCSNLHVSVGGNLSPEHAAAFTPTDTSRPFISSRYLSLKNVGTLSVAAATALPKQGYLTLHGAALSPDAATALMTDRKEPVQFDDPVDLTPEVARLLARHPGGLQLKANTIGDDVARALTEPKLEQQRLWLHLPELSPTTARFLAQRTGIVSLILQRIPVEAAAALLAHRGPVVINHPEYYRRPPQLSPTSLEILKSSWGIGLPLGAFSTPSLFFTWGATGVSRTSIIALWWLFGVGTLAIVASGLSLRRVGRHASVESPAMIERSAWNSMQTMRYASLTCSLALMLITFTIERFVLPWQHFYADERGETLPPFMVMEGSGVVLFLVPLLLWLLSLVACGRQARRALSQAKVFAVVDKPRRRYLWWSGVVGLFYVAATYVVQGYLDNHRSIGGWWSIDGNMSWESLAILLGLLAMATYSLLRPQSRWVLAIANTLLAIMLAEIAFRAAYHFHGLAPSWMMFGGGGMFGGVPPSPPMPIPPGFGILTVAWAIPLVANWFLARSGRFMMALFGSPHGGTPYHVCSSEGVAVDSAWVVPWSRFTSYEWLGDTLVLHWAGRFVLKQTLSGTVPVEERAAADALLASRLPKVGGRGG